MKRKGLVTAGLVVGLSVLSSMSAFAGSQVFQNGEWLYVDTGWKQDSTGWWYVDVDATYPVSTWKWIDENGKNEHDGNSIAYYFNENGYLATNTVVNGYTVNEDGAWTIDGVVQTMESLKIEGGAEASIGGGHALKLAVPKPDKSEALEHPEDAIIERQPVTETEPVEIRPGEDYQTAQARVEYRDSVKKKLIEAETRGIDKYNYITDKMLDSYTLEQLMGLNSDLFYDLQ